MITAGTVKEPIINRRALSTVAASQGLQVVGIVPPAYPAAGRLFERWIAEGKHGEMAFLERYRQVRLDPRQILPGCRSVVVFCMSYQHSSFTVDTTTQPQVAAYARFKDYHKVLRRKVETVFENLSCLHAYRVTVDSAPVLERALAAQGQSGFIGKNTLWISPEFGSQVVLAEAFTTLDLAFDDKTPVPLDRKTEQGGCGPCRQCQTACPTGALDEAYRLDARKCLAYWTIENRGPIPLEFWPHLAKYYFGCDICQTACPYNIKPKKRLEPPQDLEPRLNWDLFTVATMDEHAYRAMFGGTPMTRAKRTGLRRNALIAMAVTQHPRLNEAMAYAEQDGGSPLDETLLQLKEWQARRT